MEPQEKWSFLKLLREIFRMVLWRPFSQETENETRKKEDEEDELKKKNKKKQKKKKKKNKDKNVQVSMEEPQKKDAVHEELGERVMHPQNAIQRALGPEWKEKVGPVKEMMKEVTKFTDEEMYEMLEHCKMDHNLAAQRLLYLEGFEEVKGKRRKKREVKLAKHEEVTIAAGFSHAVQAGPDPMPPGNNVASCSRNDSGNNVALGSTRDDFISLPDELCSNVNQLERSSISEMPSNSGSLLNNFSSPPSSAESSVASQLHSISLDKGKEVVRHTGDDAATPSISLDKGEEVVRHMEDVQLREFALSLFSHYVANSFPQHGISFTLNDLVANADQPSELRRLLRSPFLDNLFVPSRSSTAGSQHPQTSTSESGPSEATPSNSETSCIDPFGDPQDLLLDAPFTISRYGQRPERMSENNNFAARNNQPDPGAMSTLPKPQQGGLPGCMPLPSDGNDQHGVMPSAQQEVYQGGSSSQANGNASGRGSFQRTGRTCCQSPPIPPYSPAHFNIPWTRNDSTWHAQYRNRNVYRPLVTPGPATTAHGSFPRRALLPANANNRRSGEGSSLQYDNQGRPSWQRPGTRIRPNHQQRSPYNKTTGDLQDPSSMQPPRDPGP